MPWRHATDPAAQSLAPGDPTAAQRRRRWGEPAASNEQDDALPNPQQGTCQENSVPFGPGSSPAAWLGPEVQSNGLVYDQLDGSKDDEGESMMVREAGREGRKMYFRTLDDSLNEQGLKDRIEGSEDRPGALVGVSSSSRAAPHKKGTTTPLKGGYRAPTTDEASISAKDDSAASLRNQRRARQRAKANPDAAPLEPGGCVVLIREDCRLHDNPALHAAAEEHPWVLPLFVHDDADPSPWPVRGAGLWWRHRSLQTFEKSLGLLGSRIVYRKGVLLEQVVDVLLATNATALHFNLQLEPWHHTRDLELQQTIAENLGIQVRAFTAMVMKFEPWEERKKKSEEDPAEGPRLYQEPLPEVRKRLVGPSDGWPWSLPLAALGYGRTAGRKIPPTLRQFNEKRQAMQEATGWCNPKEDDWAYEMERFWPMGEAAAKQRLEEFLKEAAWGCYFPPGLNPRDEVGGRFRADKTWTAMLSPYLRFGDLSPRYVDWRCKQVLSFDMRQLFLKRVVWRDKAYSQLYRCPDSHSVSIRQQYEHQAWSGTRLALKRWQRGETGFPLVDAAMRQLWKVGWMCNHLRHVTAQFLIEHLDLNWKDGFDWYDYTLVDTDVAINAMMWQMGGHSGIGSWNFVMHPVYAGKKVDPDGAYVRRWMPELRHLPTEFIHCPWEAPTCIRISANVLVNGVYWQRVIEDLIAARLVHQRHVIAVRKSFPQFLKADGNEIAFLTNGQVLNLDVRDDIRENDENNITLVMTPDDPRSSTRRNLGNIKGVHSSLIYEESKRFDSLYDGSDAPARRRQPTRSNSKGRAQERSGRRNQNGMLIAELGGM